MTPSNKNGAKPARYHGGRPPRKDASAGRGGRGREAGERLGATGRIAKRRQDLRGVASGASASAQRNVSWRDGKICAGSRGERGAGVGSAGRQDLAERAGARVGRDGILAARNNGGGDESPL
jgi:hypothetical protein